MKAPANSYAGEGVNNEPSGIVRLLKSLKADIWDANKLTTMELQFLRPFSLNFKDREMQR
mgnify:CR=1 FL=1